MVGFSSSSQVLFERVSLLFGTWPGDGGGAMLANPLEQEGKETKQSGKGHKQLYFFGYYKNSCSCYHCSAVCQLK